MSKIVVVGSISMDLVMRTKRIPEGGETIFGDSFNIVPGGKGANQAVAIGRLSSVEDNIYIFGDVGEDIFSADLLSNLQNNNISIEHVGTVPQSTGVAQITLYGGDNRIIYYPGANNLAIDKLASCGISFCNTTILASLINSHSFFQSFVLTKLFAPG